MAKSEEWKSSSSSPKQIMHHNGSCSSRVHTVHTVHTCRSVPVVSNLILLDQVSSSKYCTKSDLRTTPSLKSSCVTEEVSSRADFVFCNFQFRPHLPRRQTWQVPSRPQHKQHKSSDPSDPSTLYTLYALTLPAMHQNCVLLRFDWAHKEQQQLQYEAEGI